MEYYIEKTYYTNWKIKTKTPFNDKKRNGKAKSYYKNVNLKVETNHVDGIIGGYVKTFYKNGCIESVETYCNGKRNNDLIVYNRDEKIIYSCNFDENIYDDCL